MLIRRAPGAPPRTRLVLIWRVTPCVTSVNVAMPALSGARRFHFSATRVVAGRNKAAAEPIPARQNECATRVVTELFSGFRKQHVAQRPLTTPPGEMLPVALRVLLVDRWVVVRGDCPRPHFQRKRPARPAVRRAPRGVIRDERKSIVILSIGSVPSCGSQRVTKAHVDHAGKAMQPEQAPAVFAMAMVGVDWVRRRISDPRSPSSASGATPT